MERTKLGEPRELIRELVSLVHLTDAHVLDPSSPARVPFLARFGPPVQSTFRPQEALTAQVLSGAVNAIRAFTPDLVIQGGDLIDNAQNNELTCALGVLGGQRIEPGSGADGYHGVQLAANPDPHYYRPDLDTPRHPGLLTQASRPFTSLGLKGDWLPVLGDHDTLVAGELAPTPLTQAVAVGDRALWEMPTELRLPTGLRLNTAGVPGEEPDTQLVDDFLRQALAGPTLRVPPDPARYELSFEEVIERLWSACRAGAQPSISAATAAATGRRLDYVRDLGDHVRIVVLDLVRRGGGSGGLADSEQAAWLEQQLRESGTRWIMVVSHHPLQDAAGGGPLLGLLDAEPRVVATIAGHTHHNRISPRETAAGGYWMITTCSLIDFPQQCRALRLYATSGGGIALQTWMLDHVDNGPLGHIARELAHLDAGDGRATRACGRQRDRNATLFKSAAPARRGRSHRSASGAVDAQ